MRLGDSRFAKKSNDERLEPDAILSAIKSDKEQAKKITQIYNEYQAHARSAPDSEKIYLHEIFLGSLLSIFGLHFHGGVIRFSSFRLALLFFG